MYVYMHGLLFLFVSGYCYLTSALKREIKVDIKTQKHERNFKGNLLSRS